MDSLKLNLVQKAAFSLIQQDLQYIYTVIKYIKPHESNYIPSMLPYLGVGIDGAENGAICGNTILCQYYSPLFSYTGNNGEYIKSMTEIGGQYIRLFNSISEYLELPKRMVYLQ